MRTRTVVKMAGAVLLALATLAPRAAAPSSPQGVITDKIFLNIGGGTAVSDLTTNPKFPNSPDLIRYEPYFEMWATGDINTAPPDDNGNAYGAELSGYFYPATTGDFTFYICSDDNSELYLSTDDNPANKHLIAIEPQWNGKRNYTGTDRRDANNPENVSSSFKGTKWPTGNKITLTAGKAYYIQALFKEGGGGDNCSVSIDGNLPIPGNMLSSIDKTSGPASITTQPTSQTVNENQSVTFTVEPNGTPPFTFQWLVNGSAVTDATNQTFTISRVPASDNNAKVTVKVTGANGSVTSNPATLTVNPDKTAPTITSVHASADFQHVTVTFSEPVDPTTGGNPANFKINGLTVSAATLRAIPNDNIVDLTTSQQAQGQSFTLTVNNVKDIASPGNVIAANTQVTFPSFVLASGGILHRYFNAFTSGNPEDILTDPRYPGNPTFTTIEPRFEYPPDGGNEAGDNYGNELSGLLVPPVTGSYTFYICSDDHSELFLSTDDKPANKAQIASEPQWNNPRDWIDTTRRDSTSPENVSTPVQLTAGKKYFIQALHQEGGGGDNVGVAWQIPGAPALKNGDPPISAAYVMTFADPSTFVPLSIATAPVDTKAVEGRAATFSVTINSTNKAGVFFQWQSAAPGSSTFTNILSGGSSSTLTTPLLTVANNGTKFQVMVGTLGTNITSAPVTLTVVPDTFPPALVAAGSLLKGTNNPTVEIGLGFDEAIDTASATAVGNFTLSKGTVTKVRMESFDTPIDPTAPVSTAGAVVLETSGLSAGDSVTVTVKGVKDLKGNAIPAAGVSKTVTISSKMKWAAIGGDDYLQGHIPSDQTGIKPDPTLWVDDAIGLGNDKDFDLISSGTQNWNNYDEDTFVYESVTGDFDRVARVEYQDPASQWARAGIMARKTLDAGVTRDQVDAGYQMSQCMIVRVNPTVQWNGAAGNNSYEWVWRDADGGNYANSGGGGTPKYPNAWLRIQRTGQTFTGFRSDDGKTWVNIGTHTFPSDNPLPATLLVGPYYSPEMNNNGTGQGIGHSTVMKIRDYAPFSAAPPGGSIQSITHTGTSVTITFTGTLEQAPAVTGPWTAVTGSSPLQVTATGKAQFFRVKK